MSNNRLIGEVRRNEGRRMQRKNSTGDRTSAPFIWRNAARENSFLDSNFSHFFVSVSRHRASPFGVFGVSDQGDVIKLLFSISSGIRILKVWADFQNLAYLGVKPPPFFSIDSFCVYFTKKLNKIHVYLQHLSITVASITHK